MALLRLNAVSISFGDKPVLDQINLAISAGERIALVGRNGMGKSTLLKILAGEIKADSGEIVQQQGLTVTRLEQEVPDTLQGSVYHVVASGLGQAGQWLARYRDLAQSDDATAALPEMETLQARIEAEDAWHLDQKVGEILSKMQLDASIAMDTLSGGMKRRVLLARALVSDPDLLLLDEPTNHLDMDAIDWLETFLPTARASLVFITHDRAFLRKLATRIVEIDRGQVSDWPGDYAAYLRGKEAALAAEQTRQALQDKKLAQEETWIRQGIKARRTRNEGRVRALKKLRQEHAARRQQVGKARITAQMAENSGKVVLEADQLHYRIDDKVIVKDFSTLVLRGDKIGLLGPNGVGKSTLIRLLLGQLQPTSGTVDAGTHQQIAYFDQLRDALNPNKTALENVVDGADTLVQNGKSRHVISYLQDFLFAPERARAPIHALSGGERNRLLLARIFARPSNVLVLDEPTNDLDVETLELLEELLTDYAGTLLLVSHDREFLDNIVTSCFVFDGDGAISQWVGGYSDWLRQRPDPAPAKPAIAPENRASTTAKAPSPAAPRKKLSYKDQRELDALPKTIEDLESQQSALHAQMADSDFFKQSPEAIQAAQTTLQTVTEALEQAYVRWETLEAQLDGSA
ncbi:MAG TPA: ABC transporter ATP-binding protein [Gammaproteobacteria bacterium]|jgi:ATP-binding cassette subfamily F protein uup|nr:ABC transporter ATP-binding protein [Gammaproteobacteria bacterium]